MTHTSRAQAAAALVFLVSALLVAAQAPIWATLIALGCTGWRLVVAAGRIQQSPATKSRRLIFSAVTALLVLAVLVSFRTLNGLAAGTALLVVMGALKVLESRTRRDDAIVIGVSFFMLLAAALGDQSLARVPLYLLTAWIACAAMLRVAHPQAELPVRAALRLSARALAMALPLAAACFLFFPRFGGHFWALPGGGGATTGLSDTMSPGAIDQLVSEYDPVFRARFEDALPPPEQRYWRGPVLNDFDGFTWRRQRLGYVDTPREPVGEALRYRVWLEPTRRNWVFALDTVDTAPRHDIFLSHDRQLWRSEPVNDTLVYDASSHLETRARGPLSKIGRQHETRLPDGRNPRTLALARELRARFPDDAGYARAVLDWFRDNGLEYSLEPGATSLDSVDSVLFDNKRGFCGHFASAYAMLMRAAGIPARVVTGYLGGEWNPVGGYLIIRQSDAHAWTEYWLDGRGWIRADPTSVVEPERLTRGLYDIVGEAATPVSIAFRQNAWLSRLAQYWDSANIWWRNQVLDFNLRSQLDLMRALGIDSPGWEHLGWAFAAGLLLWLAWVALTLRRSVAREKPDRIARAWLRALRKLEKIAPRAPSEGAMDYARRVAAEHPHLGAHITAVATRYTRLRFGPEAANEDIAELEREVSRLAV